MSDDEPVVDAANDLEDERLGSGFQLRNHIFDRTCRQMQPVTFECACEALVQDTRVGHPRNLVDRRSDVGQFVDEVPVTHGLRLFVGDLRAKDDQTAAGPRGRQVADRGNRLVGCRKRLSPAGRVGTVGCGLVSNRLYPGQGRFYSRDPSLSLLEGPECTRATQDGERQERRGQCDGQPQSVPFKAGTLGGLVRASPFLCTRDLSPLQPVLHARSDKR